MANTLYSPEELNRRVSAAAREVFLSKGIDKAEMNDIALQAGISRSTLYRFARDKAQLAFSVAMEVISERVDAIIGAVYQGCGFQKLSTYAEEMIRVYTSDLRVLRFISDFDRHYSSAVPMGATAEKYEQEMRRHVMRSMQFLYEGMADRSIRPLEDPLLFMAALNETIFGILMRQFVRDQYYVESHRDRNLQIVREAVRILLESIRGDG